MTECWPCRPPADVRPAGWRCHPAGRRCTLIFGAGVATCHPTDWRLAPPERGEGGELTTGCGQAVAVESPGQHRVAAEACGRGHLLEIDPRPGDRRVGPPEALPATEVRKAGIHSHAGAGSDEERIGGRDQASGAGKGRGVHGGGPSVECPHYRLTVSRATMDFPLAPPTSPRPPSGASPLCFPAVRPRRCRRRRASPACPQRPQVRPDSREQCGGGGSFR